MGGGSNVSGGGGGGGGGDRKPLVLSTYLDAQEHLPYADDSAAVTPMSEDNGAIIMPLYYPTNLGQFSFFLLFTLSRCLLAKNVQHFIMQKAEITCDDVHRQNKNKTNGDCASISKGSAMHSHSVVEQFFVALLHTLNNKRLS